MRSIVQTLDSISNKLESRGLIKYAYKVDSITNKIAIDMKKRSLPKKEDPFTYKSISDEMWIDLWKKAKDNFNISFDWENNDSTKQKRVITFTDNKDPEFPTEYVFNCELWSAGGDWEYPSYYFKCQITDGSTFTEGEGKLPFPGTLSYHRDAHFILIPPKEAGNNHLVKSDKAKYSWVAIDNGDVSSKDAKNIPELDSKKAWGWLEEYLRKYMEAYLKNLDDFKNKRI